MRNIILFLFIITSTNVQICLSFSGNGSGTEKDPYQITNVHQLQEMKNDLDAHYILMNDVGGVCGKNSSEHRTTFIGESYTIGNVSGGKILTVKIIHLK